jgi:hypothetical protein
MRALVLFYLLWALPVMAAHPFANEPLCQRVAAIERLGWETVSFNEQAYQWENIPPDLRLQARVTLAGGTQLLVFMYSASANELWLFAFWSLEARTDANGQHMGNHDLCPVYKLKLRQL